MFQRGFKVSFQEHHLGKSPRKYRCILFCLIETVVYIYNWFPEPVFTKLYVK